MKSVKNTIKSRVNNGVTTRFWLRTKRGDQFNCFGGGYLSATSRSVSEAAFTKRGEVAKNSLLH